MLEYKINEFLTLKLEGSKTQIYVKGKRFLQCKRLVLNISKKDIMTYDEINSIDEAADLYKKHLYQNKIVEGPLARDLHEDHDITPEQEFWGHCSNIQAWVENDYDTRLLHSNLAFNLLKGLVDAGDPKAIRVLKSEVAERFESGYPNVVISIISAKLLDYFSPDEKKELIQQSVPAVIVYIEKIVKNVPNIFPYIFKEGLLDYLELGEREQLTNVDYPIILDFMKKEGNFFFNRRYEIIQSIMERNILAYLDQGQIKEIIHQNFNNILEQLEKIWKYYPNIFLYFIEEKGFSFYLSKEQITTLFQRYYPILLNYFKVTSLENPDLFLSFFRRGFFGYLKLKDKGQLIHQNYRIILNNIDELLKNYVNIDFRILFFLYPDFSDPMVDIFEEELFDYLTPEGQRDLIQKNFLDLLIFIEKVSIGYLRKISQKTISYIYLVVLRAIKKTPLMDNFLKKIANSMQVSDPIKFFAGLLNYFRKFYPNLFLYFTEEEFLFSFSKERIKPLFQQYYPILLNYFKTTSLENPDLFLSLFRRKYFNYLELKDKRHLLHQNYRIILNNIDEILKDYVKPSSLLLFYPDPMVDIFDVKLFDYLTPKEQRDLIQKNFFDVLIFIEQVSRKISEEAFFEKKEREYSRIWRYSPLGDRISTWRPYKISQETISYIYLVVLRAIKETPLMDDFIKKVAHSMAITDFKNPVLSTIEELKKLESTQQSNVDNVVNNYWDGIFASFVKFWKGYKKEYKLALQKYRKKGAPRHSFQSANRRTKPVVFFIIFQIWLFIILFIFIYFFFF